MIAPLILSAMAAATAASPITRNVSDVAANIVALDGQVVRVRGWINGCEGGFRCTIGARREPGDRQPSLTIDHVEALEPELGRRDGLQVMLDARVTAACSTGEYICLDRGPDLLPLRIIAVPGADLPRRQ